MTVKLLPPAPWAMLSALSGEAAVSSLLAPVPPQSMLPVTVSVWPRPLRLPPSIRSRASAAGALADVASVEASVAESSVSWPPSMSSAPPCTSPTVSLSPLPTVTVVPVLQHATSPAPGTAGNQVPPVLQSPLFPVVGVKTSSGDGQFAGRSSAVKVKEVAPYSGT